MARVALVAADCERPLACHAKSVGERARLCRIAERRAGAVRLNAVDASCINSGALHDALDDHRLSEAVWRGQARATTILADNSVANARESRTKVVLRYKIRRTCRL